VSARIATALSRWSCVPVDATWMIAPTVWAMTWRRSSVPVSSGSSKAAHMAASRSECASTRLRPSAVSRSVLRPSGASSTRPSSCSWAMVGYTEPGLGFQMPLLRAAICWITW
jgi:hypothetical protein